MTPSIRLRSLLSRILGERLLIEAAVAILPPGYSVLSDGYVDSVEAFSARSSEERWKSDRKRRALARRRWARRRSPRTILGSRLCMWISADPRDWAKGAGRIHLSADPICQEPGQYAPSGAADLGYVNESQSTNKETA